MKEPLITYENRAGTPIEAGGQRITPFSKVLILRIPGFPGGLIWNRPTSISVSNENGPEQTIPIVDVTRMALWSLLGAWFAGMIIAGLLSMRKRSGLNN